MRQLTVRQSTFPSWILFRKGNLGISSTNSATLVPSRIYDSGIPQVGLLSRLQGLRSYQGVTVHSHLLCVFPIDNVTGVTLVTVDLEPYLSWGKSYSTTEIKGYNLLQSLEN